MENQNLFSIQYASNFSGVGLHTIRAWERRYSAVNPSRTDSGRRSYTQEQIEKLKLLKDLTNKGNSISQIAALTNDELQEIIGTNSISIDSSNTLSDITCRHSPEDFSVALDRLKAAVSFKKIDILTYELEKLACEVSLRDLSMRVMIPFLRYIGDQYEQGNITVAEEHAVSSILRFHLGSYLYARPSKLQSTKTIALACPEGELHEFGIILSALLAKHYGIKFYFLGTNLPSESLLKAAGDLDVDVVILGLTNPALDRQPVVSYMEKHFQTLKDTQLWVCGRSGILKEGNYYPGLQFLESFEKVDKQLSIL